MSALIIDNEMSKPNSLYIELSKKECPDCGAKNGLRTTGMASKHRAEKRCYVCGYECIVNYKNNKLERIK